MASPTTEHQILLTVPEVAARLRCSKAHVHNLINGTVEGAHAIPAIAVGRRRLVERTSLEEWLRHSQLRSPEGPSITIPAETLQAIRDLAKDHGLSLEQALERAILALKSGNKKRT